MFFSKNSANILQVPESPPYRTHVNLHLTILTSFLLPYLFYFTCFSYVFALLSEKYCFL